jgi:uncharacterized DUF497 family protein
MVFSWDDSNREHLAKHNVTPAEAETVVADAAAPYPERIEEEKLVVWGPTSEGRILQVIYLLKAPDEVSYQSVDAIDWMRIEAGEVQDIIRIIHAMDLTPSMKRRLRRRRR